MVVLIVLLAAVAMVAWRIAQKVGNNPAPARWVIGLFGGGIAMVIVLVFVGGRLAEQRTYDNCVAIVKGTVGDRSMWDWLFGELDVDGASDAIIGLRERGEAKLEEYLPALTLDRCGFEPTFWSLDW